jgi:hypothetical protein
MAVPLHLERSPAETLGEGPAGPAQQGLHAGPQQIRIKGLDHVLIGSLIKAHHLVEVGVAGGEHQDQWLVASGRPQAPAEGQAVQTGQVEVQQHQVVGADLKQFPSHPAISGVITGVPPGLHQLAQGTPDQGIVLHDQDLHPPRCLTPGSGLADPDGNLHQVVLKRETPSPWCRTALTLTRTSREPSGPWNERSPHSACIACR